MGYKNKQDPRIKESRSRWYNDNKQKQISKQMERRSYLIEVMRRYKKRLNCSICGFTFKNNPECCDFHHTDPTTKESTIQEMLYSSLSAFRKEIKKCVPLCANCHRIIHAKNRSAFIGEISSLQNCAERCVGSTPA